MFLTGTDFFLFITFDQVDVVIHTGNHTEIWWKARSQLLRDSGGEIRLEFVDFRALIRASRVDGRTPSFAAAPEVRRGITKVAFRVMREAARIFL